MPIYLLCLSFTALSKASDIVRETLLFGNPLPRNIFSLFPDSCTQQIHAYHWLSYSLYGLLRVSEFSCPTFSFNDPDIHLLRSDVTFNLDFSMMFLHIITSKPDPFRRGATVRIAATFDKLCPVGAMRNY